MQQNVQKLDSAHVLQALCARIAEGVTNQGAVFLAGEVHRWPEGVIEALVTSGLLKKARRADRVECRGCSQRCSRPVEQAPSLAGQPLRYFVTCDLRDDVSRLVVAPERLDRWLTAPRELVAFIARELDLPIPAPTDFSGIIRLGTFRMPRARRAIALEFGEMARLAVGAARIDLAELIIWDGRRVRIDREHLELIAQEASETLLGGKRYQPSRVKQQLMKARTELRNQHLQQLADALKRDHPKWNKKRIAAGIVQSGEFRDYRNLSEGGIERIIRVRK